MGYGFAVYLCCMQSVSCTGAVQRCGLCFEQDLGLVGSSAGRGGTLPALKRLDVPALLYASGAIGVVGTREDRVATLGVHHLERNTECQI